jgi:hypothetical protein
MHLALRPLLILILPLAACTTDPSASTTESHLTGFKIITNKIITNKIITNKLAAAKVAAARLTTDRLANGNFTVNTATAADLLSTADGREVFSFLASCALPANVTLQATVGGTSIEFVGDIGLAPQWLNHPLDHQGKGWVSACMFSRVNAHDISVPISLHGPSPALTVTRDERAQYTVEEGAFYGELFTPDDQPIHWIACRGEGLASGVTGGLAERDCAKPDPAHPGLTLCGFTFAGDCGEFARDQACEAFSERGQFYRRCHASPIRGHGHGHDADRDDEDDGGHDGVFREVITTFVLP